MFAIVFDALVPGLGWAVGVLAFILAPAAASFVRSEEEAVPGGAAGEPGAGAGE